MANETDKFSWAEACSNDNGKTSGTKTMGLYWGLFVPITLICSLVAYFKFRTLDLFNASMGYLAIVASVLTGAKYIGAKFGSQPIVDNSTPEVINNPVQVAVDTTTTTDTTIKTDEDTN